jgi:hypothetical protein
MAGFQHSKNSEMFMDDTAGALRKITSYVTGVSGLPGEAEMSDITGFGDGGRKFIPGLTNASFTVNFMYNSDVSSSGGFTDMAIGIFDSQRGAVAQVSTRSFEFYPDTTASGKRKFSGECWITSVPITSTVGDAVSGTAEFQVDGAIVIA